MAGHARLQIFFQVKYFIPDPIKNDVKYQASAQPFLVSQRVMPCHAPPCRDRPCALLHSAGGGLTPAGCCRCSACSRQGWRLGTSMQACPESWLAVCRDERTFRQSCSTALTGDMTAHERGQMWNLGRWEPGCMSAGCPADLGAASLAGLPALHARLATLPPELACGLGQARRRPRFWDPAGVWAAQQLAAV